MINFKQKAYRKTLELKKRLVIDTETLLVLELIQNNLSTHYRISYEVDKLQKVDSLDYKKLNTLVSTRNGIEKALVLWFDRLQWIESEESKLEDLF